MMLDYSPANDIPHAWLFDPVHYSINRGDRSWPNEDVSTQPVTSLGIFGELLVTPNSFSRIFPWIN